MTSLGTTYFDTYASYELLYDLLGQSAENNQSYVRMYGVLHVTGYSYTCDWGSAWVINDSNPISSYYSRGDYEVFRKDYTFTHDSNGYLNNLEIWAGINTSYKSGSIQAYLTLPKINRYPVLNSGSNFTDKTNPVYNITAYGTYPLRVKIEAGGNTSLITRDLSSKNSQVYTLVLTDEERKTLRRLSPDGKTLAVRETVCAMSGGSEASVSYKNYTMTITKRPMKIRVNGAWKEAYPYVRVNGAWKEAKANIRVNGQWKEGI